MSHDERRYALRMQLTTACQLRCGYCRPDGPGALAPDALGAAELARAGLLLSRAGVDRIRLTGGEPLLRHDAIWVVARLARIPALREVTLTTNGQRLAALARPLQRAGLTRVNVHVDSLDPATYRRICGGRLDRALAGLSAAVTAGLSPKVNVVVQRGLNDGEIPAFCGLARKLGVVVRFIEIMDTGIDPAFAAGRFVSGGEIGALLERLGAMRLHRTSSAPAVEYRFAEGTTVGIIASETEPFCGSCDRLRLGETGVLRTCLYAQAGLDLGALLRSDAKDDEIVHYLRGHLAAKRSEHPGGRDTVRLGLGFSMAAIGG